LRELLRVLRPGGRLMVLEFSTPPSRLLWRVYNTYFFHVLPRLGGFLTGREQAYRYLTHSVAGFPGAREFAAEMTACGFESVSWRALTGGIVCVHTGSRPRGHA
jgi:demethylmenaquinone methyltransferase/2-methoxy-6-polyprenyl-1,4-benzoquinol methylase